MKLLNDGAGGSGGGGWKLNGVGHSGGDSPSSLLLLFSLFLGLFSLFCVIKSIPGGCEAFLIRPLAVSFLPTSSSHNSEPTIGFSASKVEIS